MRHLWPGVRTEAGANLPQETSSWTAAAIARRLDQEHRDGVHEGVHHEEYDCQDRMNGASGLLFDVTKGCEGLRKMSFLPCVTWACIEIF